MARLESDTTILGQLRSSCFAAQLAARHTVPADPDSNEACWGCQSPICEEYWTFRVTTNLADSFVEFGLKTDRA
jgi:hypothetical protein